MPDLTPPRGRGARLFWLLLANAASLCACRAPEAAAEPSAARALLERSLRYHDPDGVWNRRAIPIHWTSTKPDGSMSFDVEIELGPGGDLAMRGERGGRELEYRVENNVVWTQVDGEENVADEVLAELVLARDGGLFWRDYLGFLAGMPMCLADPSVRLEPEVSPAQLEGREVLLLRANFAPDVGTDLWTFYFDPNTAALVGCRFDREDPTRDGETIVYEGTASVAGLLLPRKRRWYMNADRRFLGTDELRAVAE